MYADKFVNALGRIGKPVVVRKKQGEGWVDFMDIAEVQRVSLKHELVAAGLLEFGDAVAYFPAWADLSADDRVVQEAEFVVKQVGEKQVGSETVYVSALLKRVHQSVQASFYGATRLFFDDFGLNRETWTIKSGSWNVQSGEYVGEAGDFEVGLSVGGQESWKDYVVEGKITLVSGNAGLVFRFGEVEGVASLCQAVLRVDEGIVALESVQGEVWKRLWELGFDLEYGVQYTVRVHCCKSFLFFFVNGEWLSTVVDSSVKTGKIGVKVLGGESKFDDVTVWEA